MFSAALKKWLLIAAGTISWSLTMVKSGLISPYGLSFWGPNGHDGVWHISLINSLAKGSLSMPIFAGETIKNYHLGFDVLLAAIHRLTTIPASILYFQIFPPVLAFLTGWLLYHFIKKITDSDSSAFWAVFFTYFSGSLGWIVGKGESAFWAQQSLSTLVNPPYALSLVLIILGLIFLEKRKIIPAIIVFALLPQIKIYAGILAFFGLFIASLKRPEFFKVLIPSAVLSAVIFFPLNTDSANLLVFKPFWFLDTLMGEDRLGWPRFYSALSTYKQGLIYQKLIPAYLFSLAIFVVGNFGVRVLGLFAYPRFNAKNRWVMLFLFSGSLLGLIFPMLFLQSGTTWNTVQFFYYSQFFFGIFAGLAFSYMISRLANIPRIIVVVFLLAFLAPSVRDTWVHYLPARPPAVLPHSEIAALELLSHQPRGTVLVPAFNKYAAAEAQKYPPRPLYLYESSAYVSAFSGHPVYLEDEVNLSIVGFDWLPRRLLVESFFTGKDLPAARKFTTDNSIKYIYLPEEYPASFTSYLTELNFEKYFQNEKVSLWRAK